VALAARLARLQRKMAFVMKKFIHHKGRLNNNMQKWMKEKEKENNNR